ncbi:MAG TPA: urea amidolyase associated protein UAAP1, partial [Polyangia bacterium]|nr:urea amidolyase associated protein UAAP1 [Polyangia bacterium]
RGGAMWSRRLRRGQALRLTDPTGRAAVAALLYNADDPLERYNMPDTLKAQYTAFLTTGRVLYSDMGRILAAITADSCGWHDTISGCGNAATTAARFGEGRYQERRNEFHRNSRDNFLVELGKHGLGKRDIVPNVNFFVRVRVDEQGRMNWVAGNSRPGAAVDLRFEMNTLVVLTNTPHPLDPATAYAPPEVRLSIYEAAPAAADDACRLSRPENARGFALTEAYGREVAP